MSEAGKSPVLDVIRVETALSRYPIHRLAKAGTVEIAIRETSDDGDTTLRWEVGYHSRYGQPGPLAYKLDTLVVNRKLEAAGRPAPRVLRLGSLREIAAAAGSGTSNTGAVKRALYQNAFAGITAMIRYRSVDGSMRSMEIGSTRYAIAFTGETLPDGLKADGVHLILSDFYREILDTAPARPLDFEYLSTLAPASQRLYELLSYRMYAALKNDRQTARLLYSEFCTFAPQSRYNTFDQVKKQMYKVHVPHVGSGYISAVAYEAEVDRGGRPDWAIVYTPGPKAKAEHQTLTGRGGTCTLDVSPVLATSEIQAGPPAAVADLVARGITPATAADLAEAHPAEKIAEKLDAFDWLAGRKDKALKRNPAGWLYRAIVDDFAPPPGYIGKAERERLRQVERERLHREDEDRQGRARAREGADAVRTFWVRLSPEDRQRVEAEAIAAADAETRASCTAGPPALRRLAIAAVRDAHIRTLLGLPASA